MYKRIGALALAVATLPLAVITVATPASAAPPPGRPCGNGYTNGQPFQLSTSPKETGTSRPVRGNTEPAYRVPRGSVVALSARLHAGNKLCKGERVGIHARDRGAARPSQVNITEASKITDSFGIVRASKRASTDFVFFARYTALGDTLPTLVQTIP